MTCHCFRRSCSRAHVYDVPLFQAQLFEGLDEDEASTFGSETFQPRRSVKRLVIKKGSASTASASSVSVSGQDMMARSEGVLASSGNTSAVASPSPSSAQSVEASEVGKSVETTPRSVNAALPRFVWLLLP